MSLRDWLAPFILSPRAARRGASPCNNTVRRRPSFRLEVTVLEERLAPALLTVDSLVDAPLSATSATLSLREAIALVDSGGKATDSAGHLLAPAKASQIDTANPFGSRDTIQFAPNLFGATPQLTTLTEGDLTLDRSVTLLGPGASLLSVSGNNQSLVFQVASGVTVSILGLTVEDGNAGGIVNDGTLTLTNSVVANNTTQLSGGGIVNTGTLTLIGTTVSGNAATVSVGGIVNTGGTLTLTGSTVSGNSAPNNGGIANYASGTLTLTDSTVSGNVAQFNNGGIFNSGTLTLTDSTVSGNAAVLDGNGGLANYGGTVALINSTVSGNSAQAVSGIGNYDGGTLTLTDSTVSANNSGTMAGGIFNDGATLTLIGSSVTGNAAAVNAGGILNSGGTLTLTSSNVFGNFAGSMGEIENDSGTLTLVGSTVAGNTDLFGNTLSTSAATPSLATSTVLDDAAHVEGVVPAAAPALTVGSVSGNVAPVDDVGTVFVGVLSSMGSVANLSGGLLSTDANQAGLRTSNNWVPDLSGSLDDAPNLVSAAAPTTVSPSLPAAQPDGEAFCDSIDAATLTAAYAASSTVENGALVPMQATAPQASHRLSLERTDPASHAAGREALFVGTPVASAAGTMLNQQANKESGRDARAMLDGYFADKRWEDFAVVSAGLFLSSAIGAPDFSAEVARRR